MLQQRRNPVDGGLMIDARDLYGALTKSNQFSRWCRRHFVREEEAIEGVDYFKFEDETYRSGPDGKWTKYRPAYGVSIAFAIRLCNLDEKYSEESDNTELVSWLEKLQHEQYHGRPVPKQEKPVYVSDDTSQPLEEEESGFKVSYLIWGLLALAAASAIFICC